MPKSLILTIGRSLPCDDEHVAGVEVVVDDVVVVEELHGGEQLPRELETRPSCIGMPSIAVERVIAPLEREVEEVVLLEGVVDVDDVRVPERERRCTSRAHSACTSAYGRFAGRNIFTRVRLVERPDALVDGAELPRPDDALDRVLPARPPQHRPHLREHHRRRRRHERRIRPARRRRPRGRGDRGHLLRQMPPRRGLRRRRLGERRREAVEGDERIGHRQGMYHREGR